MPDKDCDCSQCKTAGADVTRGREGRGRYAREIRTRGSRQSSYDSLPPDSPHLTISPWHRAEIDCKEKKWDTPTRRQADDAWIIEHERRMSDLDEKTSNMSINSPRESRQKSRRTSPTSSYERVIEADEVEEPEEMQPTPAKPRAIKMLPYEISEESDKSHSRRRSHKTDRSTQHFMPHYQEAAITPRRRFQKVLAINLPGRTDHHDGLVLAAAVSGIELDFVDGVLGKDVADKVLPPSHVDDLNAGTKGAWRAHMNALSRVVENGWSTAFIIEDDVDWDVRLHQQLQDFALGSDYLLREYRQDTQASASSIQHFLTPETSPYGDDWDVLWLGHCGSCIASPTRTVLFENDETVPEINKISSFDNRERSFMQAYPQHTRVVTRVYDTTCTLAYAVSQRGARALLYELGLQKLNAPFDNMLRDFCEGQSGRGEHKCVTVLPQLFDHHRRAVSPAFDSDISFHPGDVREKATTDNVRWSVRLNMAKLLRGETDYEDQWPDG
ncbi:hypothetical protein OHC33_008936 [Knufia fluminis]|uniref:Glycosyltransferase family 25 protein n=1 Tax=Knufia fluminis TaxID=191047 RepID=A0AAN8EBD1_9EURO|nr:hypothetical protein OHC33_008936 [Knufia fluminis]